MKALLLTLPLCLFAAQAAQAACYADYKAKRDDPLRLHYGVAETAAPCDQPEAAAQDLRPRLAADGWQLLAVVSLFGEEGLEKRRDSAGDYFLRY
ncbi:hypothetical protein [Limimaricola pyoseonensis]|uniref:DUF4177 domain-containing protein n=1 Tax=Limimaricola pyoseonensis TaxID=521013 RepID=A0A1G7EZ05_9RHOB|nr:hypothetical protein [Limimaricola pyoseonensis]SDE68950.1 hypothetical protein SAMN04488567_2358 [Limimaricola pyoseonensis]